jgi:hypothetical protein
MIRHFRYHRWIDHFHHHLVVYPREGKVPGPKVFQGGRRGIDTWGCHDSGEGLCFFLGGLGEQEGYIGLR